MPIRPEMRALYPPEWPLISDYIRFDRAMGRCECDGRCGGRYCQARLGITARCPNYHGDPNVVTRSKVVLTTAHLDNDPPNCDPGNLLALCQQCHLSLDRDLHAATRAANREKRDNQMSLLDPEEFPDGPAQLELPKIPVFENDGQAIAWFGTDGLRWTAAFLHAADLANAGPDFVGTVHGWFCNAIEVGRTAGAQALARHYQALMLEEWAQAQRGDWSGDGRALKVGLDKLVGWMRAPETTPELAEMRQVLDLCPAGEGHWTEHCGEGCAA